MRVEFETDFWRRCSFVVDKLPRSEEAELSKLRVSTARKGRFGVLLLLGLLFFRPSSETPGEAINSLAVLPFENTRNDPNVEYLSDGIPESLIDRLSQVPPHNYVSWRRAPLSVSATLE